MKSLSRGLVTDSQPLTVAVIEAAKSIKRIGN